MKESEDKCPQCKSTALSFLLSVWLIGGAAVAADAQVAQSGTYRLEQAVISSGGGTSSGAANGNTYTLDGVIGEPVAGTTSSLNNFSVKGGFLSSPTIAPTVATVSISGRVLTADGSGLLNARVTLTDSMGNTRTITTRKGGVFRFDDVEAGAVYILRVGSRHYTFQSQVVSAMENLTGIDFTAQESTILQ